MAERGSVPVPCLALFALALGLPCKSLPSFGALGRQMGSGAAAARYRDTCPPAASPRQPQVHSTSTSLTEPTWPELARAWGAHEAEQKTAQAEGGALFWHFPQEQNSAARESHTHTRTRTRTPFCLNLLFLGGLCVCFYSILLFAHPTPSTTRQSTPVQSDPSPSIPSLLAARGQTVYRHRRSHSHSRGQRSIRPLSSPLPFSDRSRFLSRPSPIHRSVLSIHYD